MANAGVSGVVCLRHGEFLGREINRICAPGFIVTFRRSTSGRKDERDHSHCTANLLLPLDSGYWSQADEFDDANPLQMVYTPADTSHRDSMVRFGGRYLAISVDNGLVEGLDRDLRFPIAVGRPLATQIAHRLAVVSVKGYLSGLLVEDACLMILAELVRDARAKAATPPRWLKGVMEMCHDTSQRTPPIAEIAAMIGVHPVHLTRVFRGHYGIPLSRYIASVRIERAAAGLRDRRLSVAAIALENGFWDHSHLCSAFKAAMGVTPRAYRALFLLRSADRGPGRRPFSAT